MSEPTPSTQEAKSTSTFWHVLCATLLTFVFIKAAWISEDAYITFRTVDNFVTGHGLTWNPAERVQVYTHPLWMFVVASLYFFTREIIVTISLLSIALSLGAVIVLGKTAKAPHTALVASGGTMTGSRLSRADLSWLLVVSSRLSKSISTSALQIRQHLGVEAQLQDRALRRAVCLADDGAHAGIDRAPLSLRLRAELSSLPWRPPRRDQATAGDTPLPATVRADRKRGHARPDRSAPPARDDASM